MRLCKTCVYCVLSKTGFKVLYKWSEEWEDAGTCGHCSSMFVCADLLLEDRQSQKAQLVSVLILWKLDTETVSNMQYRYFINILIFLTTVEAIFRHFTPCFQEHLSLVGLT